MAAKTNTAKSGNSKAKYQVIKDGHIIAAYSTLNAAKKKAAVSEADIYEGSTLLYTFESLNDEINKELGIDPNEKTGEQKAIEEGLIKGGDAAAEDKTESEKAIEQSEDEVAMRSKTVRVQVLLNIRDTPSKTGSVIGFAIVGKVYSIQDTDKGKDGLWIQIKYGERIGYILASDGNKKFVTFE